MAIEPRHRQVVASRSFASLSYIPVPLLPKPLVPLRRLADVDTILADEAKFAQTAGPEGLKSLARLTAESTGREEAVILAVDPKLSYPDAEDLAMDPEFWKDWLPKAAPKAKAPKAK